MVEKNARASLLRFLTMMTRETSMTLPTMTRQYQWQSVMVLQLPAGPQNGPKDNSHG